MNDFARDLGTLLALGLVAYFSIAVPLAWRRDEMRRHVGRWERARRALADACAIEPKSGPPLPADDPRRFNFTSVEFEDRGWYDEPDQRRIP